MKRWMIWAMTLSLLLACSIEGWARTWKDKTGKFSVEAELIEVKDGKAVLKRTDGKIIRAPIDQLSAADVRYLASLKKPAAESATPPNKKQPPRAADSEIAPPVAPAKDASSPAWMMNLSRMKIPDGRVFGKLHNQRFVPDNFKLSGGNLTFQEGKDVFPPRKVSISMFLKDGEDLRGKTFRFPPSEEFGQPFVRVTHEKKGSTFGESKTYMNKYAMVLSFGQSKNGQLPGKIYLCVPDDSKSVVAGSFLVEVFDDTHPKTTKSRISGRVTVKGSSQGID